MKNVLVLGKGYISSKIEKYWSLKDYNLVRVARSEVDYLVKLDELIEKYKPVFVVNCYGFTGKPNVDSCEDHKEECFQRNVTDTTKLYRECEKRGVNFITISTGCVHNDETGKVFTEKDIPNFGLRNPTSSTYSRTKGEFQSWFTMASCDTFSMSPYLLRIRMPFDDEFDDKNYINKIIKYDKLVNYQNSVTHVYDLVKFIEIIVQDRVPRGIYNVVNKDPIKAEDVLELYKQVTGIEKKVDRWYSTDDLLSMGLMKCRRSNCVLSTEKIEKYYPELPTSRMAIYDALENWVREGKE
jgi:dTDP-4-dehydrorhamnose reductase